MSTNYYLYRPSKHRKAYDLIYDILDEFVRPEEPIQGSGAALDILDDLVRAEDERNRLHIGLNAWPNTFTLHVFSETLLLPQHIDDWKVLFTEPHAVIVDEYGRSVSIDEMIKIIGDDHRRQTGEFS